MYLVREQHRSRHHKKRQGDPHEHPKPTGLVHKLALSRSEIGGLLKERDRDKREKQHASNPKGRRCQMNPNKSDVKECHLLDCNEITMRSLPRSLANEEPIILIE